jgi:hypothetical protein
MNKIWIFFWKQVQPKSGFLLGICNQETVELEGLTNLKFDQDAFLDVQVFEDDGGVFLWFEGP